MTPKKIQEIFEKVLKEKEKGYTDGRLEEIRKEREYVESIVNDGIQKSNNMLKEFKMNLKYKFCNIFSEFSFENLIVNFLMGILVLTLVAFLVILYATIFSFLVGIIGSTTIAILLCVVLTIIVLVLGSLLDVS
ncbi:hypothetical protein [Campylobacter phage vB_Cj_QDYZ]|uniref:Uncharacterized protein n=1 Tax=Campylobacter phage vB_Cj_QDYZ TaxID=3032374 RepID=A0AAF0JYN8_9CAUD|nr:hypothetical protein [Campylobacter phage vB_Cj_QDYZ]